MSHIPVKLLLRKPCMYLAKNLCQNNAKNPYDSKTKDNTIFKNVQNTWKPHKERHTTG